MEKDTINNRLLKYKQTLYNWKQLGGSYNLSIDWVELNQLATDLGNPFMLGCSSCRTDLANFIWEIIKDRQL